MDNNLEELIETIQKWPEWKREIYNTEFASANSIKLKEDLFMQEEHIYKLETILGQLIDKYSKYIENNNFETAMDVMRNIDHIVNILDNLTMRLNTPLSEALKILPAHKKYI